MFVVNFRGLVTQTCHFKCFLYKLGISTAANTVLVYFNGSIRFFLLWVAKLIIDAVKACHLPVLFVLNLQRLINLDKVFKENESSKQFLGGQVKGGYPLFSLVTFSLQLTKHLYVSSLHFL